MRVLTDPVETGAVTLSLPQDVQAEAFDWEDELFARRVWHVARPAIDDGSARRAVDVIRAARTPLDRGRRRGDLLAVPPRRCALFAEATGVPVAETQAGKGSLPYDHPQSVGALGATGTTAADALAAEADLVLGIGTRYSDFTTASKTVFAHPDVRFVNLNVAAFDAHKLAAVAAVADARRGLEQLTDALAGWHAPAAHTQRAQSSPASGTRPCSVPTTSGTPRCRRSRRCSESSTELSGPRDVVVCAAGSMPGDLHKLWRTRDPKGYHVEYGFSCMGYEIAGGLGVKMAVARHRARTATSSSWSATAPT